jgi:DNA modification methylase
MPPLDDTIEPIAAARLTIAYADIDAIKLNAKNPRRHAARAIQSLANSIAALGMNVPLIVDADLMLLAGEARLKACKSLGWTRVPIIRLEHLTPEQASLFMIAENRFSELSQFDERALGQLFRDLSVAGLDLSLEVSGFEMGEIDLKIEALSLAPVEESEDIALAPGAPVTKPGELWLLRNPETGLEHRLLVGDALLPSSYPRLMGDACADMVITDPPFGAPISSYLTGAGKTKHREFVMGSEGRSAEELADLLRPFCVNAHAAARPGALVYVFMDWRGIGTLLDVGEQVFGAPQNIIVWAKTNAGMGSLYRSQHELIALFKIDGGAHRNNVRLGAFGRNRTNVWTYAGMNTTAGRMTEEGDLLALHPTVKPVAMIADAILDCSERGDVVLDPFVGSGTTIIAAERTGRRACAIELDPLYADCAIRRWQRLTGRSAIRDGDGQSFSSVEAAGELEAAS